MSTTPRQCLSSKYTDGKQTTLHYRLYTFIFFLSGSAVGRSRHCLQNGVFSISGKTYHGETMLHHGKVVGEDLRLRLIPVRDSRRQCITGSFGAFTETAQHITRRCQGISGRRLWDHAASAGEGRRRSMKGAGRRGDGKLEEHGKRREKERRNLTWKSLTDWSSTGRVHLGREITLVNRSLKASFNQKPATLCSSRLFQSYSIHS